MRFVAFLSCLHRWSFSNVNFGIKLQRRWQSQMPPQSVAQTTTPLSCEGHKSKFTMRLACTSKITSLNQSEREKEGAAGNSPNKSMHLFGKSRILFGEASADVLRRWVWDLLQQKHWGDLVEILSRGQSEGQTLTDPSGEEREVAKYFLCSHQGKKKVSTDEWGKRCGRNNQEQIIRGGLGVTC